ncbi:bifunctional helix-turn-helix domain-containing protein/methylated-DNA--[protein]-cysteine S-methyltransferase [Seonamhaeicola marinus]|uniref:methylated-DNA--[protein]-cysteine S-methyltransferase n=1 Tax=Seonamhaeicola marinus TaxID=1912246 RepID=A0A5D0H6M7_9FLAO|nr:methylated-DNA--[protein]-cysteine S-methyltransferase [Seonamhaeicola marinus]TYA66009.1 methylated-DNA--[protein]-cysteine S-methyltransferase [Seonamhaeicola marinus]
MNAQDVVNYTRIADAIAYIQDNFTKQPTLEDIAKEVNLSAFHFQRLFTNWAGVSPKKFLQFVSVQHAKKVLKTSQSTLFDTAYETGLSGTGRLHDLFMNIEGMTPGDYKNQGAHLVINYSYFDTIFGKIMIASTQKGICYMGFSDATNDALSELKSIFPKAILVHQTDELQQNAMIIYSQDWTNMKAIKFHLKGSPFQLKIWETLLRIPLGTVASYGDIAKEIGNPKASRAVGSAIGKNPVACLIPCHRIIQSSGALGNYRWGSSKKMALIGWEAANRTIQNKGAK